MAEPSVKQVFGSLPCPPHTEPGSPGVPIFPGHPLLPTEKAARSLEPGARAAQPEHTMCPCANPATAAGLTHCRPLPSAARTGLPSPQTYKQPGRDSRRQPRRQHREGVRLIWSPQPAEPSSSPRSWFWAGTRSARSTFSEQTLPSPSCSQRFSACAMGTLPPNITSGNAAAQVTKPSFPSYRNTRLGDARTSLPQGTVPKHLTDS